MNTRMRFTLKFFSHIQKKKKDPGKLHCPFVTRRVSTVIIFLKVVKPSSDCKMIKLLTFDDLFPPQRHSR